MTTTLASILAANLSRAESLHDVWSACGGKVPMQFIRNDYLDTRADTAFPQNACLHPDGSTASNTRCKVFADDETLRKFDTLVVNSGAHPREGNVYKAQMLETSRVLSETMARLHGEEDAFMVLRTTVPGHWGCTER